MIEFTVPNASGKLYLCGPQDAKKATGMRGVHICATRGNPAPGMSTWQKKESSVYVDALCPSADLLFNFWCNSTKDAIAFKEYTRRWNEEKSKIQRYHDACGKIAVFLIAGHDVFLGCWCKDKSTCHVSLIAEYVKSEFFS